MGNAVETVKGAAAGGISNGFLALRVNTKPQKLGMGFTIKLQITCLNLKLLE